MKIDVTIATKNNCDSIEKVITAVKSFIPYNEIILVDDSSDLTPQIGTMLGARVYNIEGLIGHKRIMQAKLSKTEWIACIDSDVFVYPNWWEEMSKHIGIRNIASVHGYLESDFKNLFPEYELYTKFCSALRSKIVHRIGSFSNLIIRREALLMCEDSLRGVHAGEDTIIGKVLKKKGYDYAVVRAPVGFHWHKDPIQHHVMAYYRAGESMRMRKRKTILATLPDILRFLILQLTQLALFNLINYKFYTKLNRFIFHLSLLYISGLTNSQDLRHKVIQGIKSSVND